MYEVFEVENDSGFFSCKEFPLIVASKSGVFKRVGSNKVIEITYPEGLYPTITYPGPQTVHVHRLLAYMFVEKPEDFMDCEYVVNHKDGVKTNFELSNLEWVTYSRNATHAYETGLRNDNIPILVKDLRTSSYRRFYSLQECARHFKVNGFNIHWNLLPRNRGKLCFNYYVMIREGDVWPSIDPDLLGKHRNGRPKPVVVIDVESNSAIIYDSAGSAARANGIKPGTLTMWMHRRPTTAYNGKLYKYTDDKDLASDIEMVSVGRRTHPPKRKPIPILVKNTKTGDVTKFESVEEFGKTLDVSKNTIQKRMLVTGGRWRNYFITYVRPLNE